MPWLAVAAVGAQVLSGAMGSAASAEDREAALSQNQQAVKAWLDVNVPDPEQQKVVLQRFVQQGTLSPELEQAVTRDVSAYEKIQTDPRLKQSRLKALSSLEELGSSGGMTLSDEANLQKGLNDINVADRGRREAIADNAARRGISGSGFDQANQLRNAQDATNRQSQQQLDVLGSARDRALKAIMASGDLAGSIQQQDYNQQKDLAGARDSIADFNARALAGVNQRNTAARNITNAQNLKSRQDISNANVGIANQQETQNKGVYQQDFNNRAAKAAGLTGQYQQLGNAYNNAADRTAGTWAGVGSAVGKAGSAYANYDALNKYLDKDKEDEGETYYYGDN